MTRIRWLARHRLTTHWWPTLGLAMLLTVAPAFAAVPEPLTAGDIPALLAPPAKGVRVIELWALDCAYCEANLGAVAALHRQRRDVIAVTVATDDIAHAEALQRRLTAAGAADVPARAYAGSSRERLDYLIDPHWGGETPRTLVIHANGSRRTVSGALTPERLRALLSIAAKGE